MVYEYTAIKGNNMKKINWNKSAVGYVTSKCGVFSITPSKCNYQNGKIIGYKLFKNGVFQHQYPTQQAAKQAAI